MPDLKTPHFPQRAPIDYYGNGGFRFADMSHKGSIVLLPSGIYAWPQADSLQTRKHKAIIDETILPPKIWSQASDIDILFIGTGNSRVIAEPTLATRCRQLGIVLETMNTGAAVRSFNIMLAEHRAIAAAFVAVD